MTPAKMKTDPEYHQIIERIRDLPDVPPTANLSAAIMQKIGPRKVSWWGRVRFALSRPFSITIVPMKWIPAGAICMAVLMIFTLQMQSPWSGQWDPQAQEAEFSYITGRRYLAENQPEQALPYLQEAAANTPENADYHFWLGVAYWATQDAQHERQSYQAALELNPQYLPAHVYMGHNYLDQGSWKQALQHYGKVLKAMPDHPEALFNSALAYRKMGLREKENAFWSDYLDVNNGGEKAAKALNHLNSNGDFTYQSILLGTRKVVLRSPEFEAGETSLLPTSHDALLTAGRFLRDTPHFNLHVIVYQANDANLARNRAKTIKAFLLNRFPEIERHQIKISWFDVAGTIEHNGRTDHLDSVVRWFTVTAEPSNNA